MKKAELNKLVKSAKLTLGDLFKYHNKSEVLFSLLAKELGVIDRGLTDRKTRLGKK